MLMIKNCSYIYPDANQGKMFLFGFILPGKSFSVNASEPAPRHAAGKGDLTGGWSGDRKGRPYKRIESPA